MTDSQEPSERPESPLWDSLFLDVDALQTIKLASSAIAAEFQEFSKRVNALFREFAASLKADYSKFVEGEIIQNLMRHGWFPDFGLSFREITQLAEAFSDDPEQANEVMLERFRDRVDEIEAETKGAFPNRSEILHDAFQAHRQGLYNLSVAVFLTQADGFCNDRLVRSLFLRGDRKAIEEMIEQMPDGLIRVMARALLYDRWPLVTPRKQRQQQPDGPAELNRHQVLHGEVTDYGTEENSLKAISLLNYCAFVLPEPEPAESPDSGVPLGDAREG